MFLTQGHVARKWQSQISNSVLFGAKIYILYHVAFGVPCLSVA